MNPVTAYLLYAVVAVGGVALVLLLPRGRGTTSLAGGVLGMATLALLMVLLMTRFASEGGVSGFFYLFSFIAIASAARVITHRQPVYSALYFVVTVLAVAALMVLQRAEFLAIALVIIYAGAILVTYLFVIMLAQSPGSPVYDHRSREPLITVFACFLLMAAIMGKVGAWSGANGFAAKVPPGSGVTARLISDDEHLSQAPNEAPPSGNTIAVGWAIMTRFVVALELAAVLLLVSMVGAIAMSRRKVRREVPDVLARPLGQVGKEVEPF